MYGKYDWFFHRHVAQLMNARLDYVKVQPRQIVLAGIDGNQIYPLLAKRFPKALFCEIAEQESALLESARLRGKPSLFSIHKKVRQICQDWAISPIPATDLLISNLALHTMLPEKISAVFKLWQHNLNEQGMLFLSTLGIDSLREVHGLMQEYGIDNQRLRDMHDWGDLLLSAGFGDPVVDSEKIMLNYATADGFWRDMRALGIAFQAADKQAEQAFYNAIEKQFATGCLKEITLEIVQIHAIKPPMREDGAIPIHFHHRS